MGLGDISYLDRDAVKARLLMSVGWYRLIDIFGLKNMPLLLTDDVLKQVWVDDLRKQYEFAGQVISGILSEVRLDDFERDREMMISDMITGGSNRLAPAVK